MRILIVSTLVSAPWGGSEELWARAALALRNQGVDVMVVRPAWAFNHPKMAALRAAGVRFAPLAASASHSFGNRVLRAVFRRSAPTAANLTLRRCIPTFTPDLVLISEAGQFDARPWFGPCQALGLRFATLTQVAVDQTWPQVTDIPALQSGYHRAVRCYFVSRANLELTQMQLGATLSSAQVVWNPFNVSFDTAYSWPDANEPIRFACVARLDPSSKGQDLLLGVLAQPHWRGRNWQLSLFGQGAYESVLRDNVARLGFMERVNFFGHVPDIAAVWQNHHALVLASRFEGMPLAAIEAMLCHRPVIATDSGGNTEIIVDGDTGFVAAGATTRALDYALERAWSRRDDWPALGRKAGAHIRRLVPRDPGAELAHLLLRDTRQIA